jgi:hypothetical protein
VQLFGGAREVPVAGDSLDVPELAKLHVVIDRKSRSIT